MFLLFTKIIIEILLAVGGTWVSINWISTLSKKNKILAQIALWTIILFISVVNMFCWGVNTIPFGK